MNSQCPISPAVVDEPSTRIGAALTLLVAAVGVVTGQSWILLLLAADFGLRSQGRVTFSPIAQLSRGLRVALGIAPRSVNAGPKRFAALIGVFFSMAISLALFTSHPLAAGAVAAVLVSCAALEAFFGFCVGCKVHGLLQRLNRPKAPPSPNGFPIAGRT